MTHHPHSQSKSIWTATTKRRARQAGQFLKWRNGRRQRFWWYMAAHAVAAIIFIIGWGSAVIKESPQSEPESAKTVMVSRPTENWWAWPATAIMMSWALWVPVKVGAYIGWQMRYSGMVAAYNSALSKIAPKQSWHGDPRNRREMNAARESLRAKYRRKKPDWYDLAVAFGTVTWWEFMFADPSLANTTIVKRHQNDWYEPSSGGWGILGVLLAGYDGSGNGSVRGGGRSSGGGGFGGGGATSGW